MTRNNFAWNFVKEKELELSLFLLGVTQLRLWIYSNQIYRRDLHFKTTIGQFSPTKVGNNKCLTMNNKSRVPWEKLVKILNNKNAK